MLLTHPLEGFPKEFLLGELTPQKILEYLKEEEEHHSKDPLWPQEITYQHAQAILQSLQEQFKPKLFVPKTWLPKRRKIRGELLEGRLRHFELAKKKVSHPLSG